MRRRALSPPQLLSVHIAGLVVVGGVLLSLPFAAAPGHDISALDAFFTSTSAVCVTGLVVRDTPVDFSIFGQVVILLLIQAGGLGYMTLTTMIATALGKRLTLQERMTLQESLNVDSMEGLLRFALRVVKMTVAIEAAGALILTVRWAGEYGVGRALFLATFHSVSAFNNAGFSLFSDSLVRYRGDVTVNLVVTSLIIAGGLGFVVLSEIGRIGRRRLPFSLHTRLVLSMTAVLLAGGMLALYLLERNNPRTLGPLGGMETLLAVWFQAVSARTAGFNTLNLGAFTPPALFLLMLLMFVGASPGGTGGGVKTTTFGIALAALWATIRRGHDVVVFGRRLPADLVLRAFFVSLIGLLATNLVVGLLLISDGHDVMGTIFETTSAFGTVGLSVGHEDSVLSLVGHFSVAGKLLVALMMFIGRVGPLTLAVSLAARAPATQIRYPEGKVLIG